MLKYNQNLKNFSRKLKKDQTPGERKLWKYLRKNQINNLRFTRQKPIGKYIADFYCHKLKLVIEIDGDRHFKNQVLEKDKTRDEYFNNQNLKVLRFNNYEVYKNIEGILKKIWIEVEKFEKRK
jgi:5-methyltetrahydrofolate--homocysteine methyltransferase/ATP-dependent helicase HrpA